MLAPATRPCSCAVGSIAWIAGSPVTRSRPSATSPAAYTLATLEPGPERQDRVQDRERDEAGADHDDVAARRDVGEDTAGLVERPERVDTPAVGAGDGRPHRRRPGRDEAVVVRELRAVVEGADAG